MEYDGDWPEDLEFGEEGEEDVARRYNLDVAFTNGGKYWDIKEANERKREVKTERLGMSTGRHYVEFADSVSEWEDMSGKSGHPSGIDITTADLWDIVWGLNGEIITVTVPWLRDECPRSWIVRGGDGNRTRGFLVNRNVLREHAVSVLKEGEEVKE